MRGKQPKPVEQLRTARERLVLISVWIEKKDLDRLNRLVTKGHYASRSEAIRDAIKRLVNTFEFDEEEDEMELLRGR